MARCGTLKLLLNEAEEERIFVDNVASLGFDELVQLAREKFPAQIGFTPLENLLFQYVDSDEELVTIKSSEELAIAFDSVPGSDPALCVIISIDATAGSSASDAGGESLTGAVSEEADDFEVIQPDEFLETVPPPSLPEASQSAPPDVILAAPVEHEESSESQAQEQPQEEQPAEEEISQAHLEVANKALEETLPQEASALFAALQKVVEDYEKANVDKCALSNLRGVLAQAFVDPTVVADLQEALGSPLVRDLVVEVSAAEREGQDPWKAVSKHLVLLLKVVSELIEKHPILVALIPPLTTSAVLLSKAQQEQAKNTSNDASSSSSESAVIHKHVQCNGCLELRPNVEYIHGVRYKSAVVEDFDLCESCEASNKYRDTHGPFLKIYTPAQAPEAILCVLRGDRRNRETAFAQFAQKELESAGNAQHEFRLVEGENAEQVFQNIASTHVAEAASIAEAVASAASAPAPQPSRTNAASTPRSTIRPQARFILDLSFPDGSVVSPGQTFHKKWRVKNSSNGVKWPNGCRIVNVGGEPFGAPTCGVPVPALESGQEFDITIPMIAPARAGRAIGYFRLITPDNQRFGHRLWADVTVDGSLGERIAATVVRPFRVLGEQIVARVQEYEAGNAVSTAVESAAAPSPVPDTTANVSASPAPILEQVESTTVEESNEYDNLLRLYSIEVSALNNMGFKDNKKILDALKNNGGDIESTITQLLE